MIQRDNLHYSFRHIDGYNKAFTIVIGARETGKTTSMWMDKIYNPWKKNFKPWVFLVRQAVEIDDSLITTIFDTNMNKFTDDNLVPIYKPSTFSSGIVDIYLNVKNKDGSEEKKLFLRMLSLNCPVYRLKKHVLRNIGGVFMDEFIINPEFNEKYISKEYSKLQELYSTLRREADGVLKCYFCGNVYSLFNPLFVGLGVDVSKLKIGEIYVGNTYVIEWAKMSDALREKILEENPFYKFDEDYQKYAVLGEAVNDRNIKLSKLPKNFYLHFVIKMDNKYIGIFRNNYIEDLEDKFYCRFLDEVSAKRTIYCFDFQQMVERSILVSLDERYKLQKFKEAMRKRIVSFEDINVYYYCEEVFKNI